MTPHVNQRPSPIAHFSVGGSEVLQWGSTSVLELSVLNTFFYGVFVIESQRWVDRHQRISSPILGQMQ